MVKDRVRVSVAVRAGVRVGVSIRVRARTTVGLFLFSPFCFFSLFSHTMQCIDYCSMLVVMMLIVQRRVYSR